MSNLFKFLMISFFLSLTSCLPSIHPLYTDQDLISDAELVGTWSDKDNMETWVLTESGDKEYKVIHSDKDGKSGEFTARLLRTGGKTFLDLTPIRATSKSSDFHGSHFLKLHTFVLVSKTSSTAAQLSILEPEWLADQLEKKPATLKHEIVGNEIVLTASSKELQAFIVRHADTPGAFSKPGDCALSKRGAK